MEYSDAQVNDCAERLSQLGIPVNGSTNPKVGYIKNPMACERCVYGSGEHADWCCSRPHISFAEATKHYPDKPLMMAASNRMILDMGKRMREHR